MSQQSAAWVIRVGAVAVAVMFGCSHEAPPPAPPPTPQVTLCSLPSPDAGVGIVPTLRWTRWASLLLRGYQEDSQPGALTDCTGVSVGWGEATTHCADPGDQGHSLGYKVLTEDDVIIQRTTAQQRLVWVQGENLSTGEVQGPVALVDFANGAAQVRAIGSLRNFPRRARLRLETLGDQRVLVAEGETCEHADDPTTCRRAVRILLIRHGRFESPAVRFERNGHCVGPARFAFQTDRSMNLPNGQIREFTLHTSLQYRPGTVLVHEQVDIDDHDPRRPLVPPRPFRRAGADRLLWLLDGRFVTNERSLWDRVLEEEASVTAEDGGYRDGSTDANDADYIDDATAH